MEGWKKRFNNLWWIICTPYQQWGGLRIPSSLFGTFCASITFFLIQSRFWLPDFSKMSCSGNTFFLKGAPKKKLLMAKIKGFRFNQKVVHTSRLQIYLQGVLNQYLGIRIGSNTLLTQSKGGSHKQTSNIATGCPKSIARVRNGSNTLPAQPKGGSHK